jgi:hypothetical protein
MSSIARRKCASLGHVLRGSIGLMIPGLLMLIEA